MSILSVITSIADLSEQGLAVVSTTAANLAPNVSEGFVLPPNAIARHRFAQKTADIWLSFYLYKNGVPNGLAVISFYDSTFSTTQAIFRLNQTATNSNLYEGQMWNGSAWVDVSAESFTITNTLLTRLDLHVKIADSGGAFECWSAGSKVITGTITDTLIAGVTGIDIIEFGGFNISNTGGVYSAVIIADEDTRAMVMAQRLPTGNGANTEWVGAFGDVDETGFTDTDFITATANGQKETFTHAALPAEWATGYEIEAVAISGRMMNGQGSGLSTHGLLRIGGVDYDIGSMDADVATKGCQKIIEIDPSTGSAWGLTNAAAEFGVLASNS